MKQIRVRLAFAAAPAILMLLAGVGMAAPLQVVARSPERLTAAARTAAVTITFDRAVDHSSITSVELPGLREAERHGDGLVHLLA